jgi:endonuclease YncB( thermonuclease family)
MLKTFTPRLRHWLKYLVICLGCLASGVSAEVLLGTVIAVHDGDTVTLQNESGQKKIRLAGIDAPELNQPYGVESRHALKGAVLDRQVQVETTKADKYGRVVGKVIVDGQDINLKQLQLGMAWAYREYLRELSKVDKALYLEAEAQSKAIPFGLWRDSNPVEPWIWRKK